MPKLLPQRLTESVARSPRATCLVSAERRVTYAELGAAVDRAAAAIGSRVEQGERVAILAENSLGYVAACYGAWRARVAVLGLNTALKADNLSNLVRHSGARLLIVDQSHPEREALIERLEGVPILEFDRSLGFTAEDRPLAGREVTGSDVASIVYTSGTTGHPKGVTLTHANLAANTDGIVSVLGVRADDLALCVLPFQYSYGASVLHSHLAVGAGIIMERSLLYPRAVLARAVEEGVTSFAGVPSTFYLLLERTDLSEFDLSSLRYVTQAGGRMEPAKIREFRRFVPGAEFFVMYGQTEATARLTILPPADLSRKEGSVGLPLPDVHLRIVDDAGEPVPPGTTGEVLASGPNVMLGYWADPAETAVVLRDGWLRTGDVGHLDPEGYLFLEGRSSEMIKSGAHRIAPGQIEEVIRATGGVVDAAVAGTPDELLGQVVTAWVIARQAGPDTRREILRRCATALPRFMLPKAIHFVESFPRTASGKVRKHLLPQLPGT